MSKNREDKYAKLRSFIQLYRNLPVLWNSKSKEYFDKDKKSKAYKQLLANYQTLHANATVNDVKRKINALRTNYRRESKKMLLYKNIGKPLQPSWTFSELKFLDDYYKEINKSVRIEQARMRKEQVWEFNYDIFEQEESDALRSAIIEKSEDVQEAEMYVNEEEATPKFFKLNTTSREIEESIVAKNWFLKIQKLKPDQRIWAEKFINDILTEGELGTIHRHFMSATAPKPCCNPN